MRLQSLFPKKSSVPFGASSAAVPTLTRGAAPADPDNLSSELGASEYAKAAPAERMADQDVLAWVEENFQAAVRGRQSHDAKFFLSLAFYLGEQNMGWSVNNKRLVSTVNPQETWRTWEVRNKIQPKILKLQARATEGAPDASFRPTLWERDMDRQAAAEARAVRQHQNRIHNEDQQLSEECLWAMTTSTVCRKYSWDATARAEVPDYDADGSLVGTVMAPVGEIARETIPIFDLYVDPKARIQKGRITHCAWIIHSHSRSINDVHAHYGVMVDGDVPAGHDGYIESRMASIVGDAEKSSEDKKTAVQVREMWVFPCPRYPNGVLVVTGGGKVLRPMGDWPTQKRDAFPFVPLSYTNGLGTFYGGNAVYNLISAQRTYNLAINREASALHYPWGKWLVPRGAEVGANELSDPGQNVYFNPGFRPEYVEPPQVAPVVEGARALADNDIGDLSGVHDVSDGEAPTGVTAASALEILRQQDATQMRQFLTNLGTFVKGCAEWEIALASENYSEPRLMAVEDVVAQGTPPADGPETKPGANQGFAQVMAFRALTSGGSCHVTVEPGSSAPMSAVARQQLITQLFAQGFFGQPGDPRASMIALEMMDEIRSDALIERLITLRNEMTAEAQSAQQAQQQQAAQQAQVHLQQQQQSAALQSQLQAEAAQQQAALGQLAAAQKAAAQATEQQHEAELKMAELRGELAKMQVSHAHDLELQAQEIRRRQSDVRVSLTGQLVPQETETFAREAATDASAAPPVAAVPPSDGDQPGDLTQNPQATS